MDRRALTAILFCVIFYLAYSQYLTTKYPNYNKPLTNGELDSQSTADLGDPQAPLPGASGEESTAGAAALIPAEEIEYLSEQDLTFETDKARFQFDQRAGALASVRLKEYQEKVRADSEVELLTSPLILHPISSSQVPRNFAEGFFAQREGRVLKFWREEAGWRLTSVFEFPESGYSFKYKAIYENISNVSQNLTTALLASERVRVEEDTSGSILPGAPTGLLQLIVGKSEDVDRIEAKSLCQEGSDSEASAVNAPVHFIGFDQHYFLQVLIPDVKKLSYQFVPVGGLVGNFCQITLLVHQDYGQLAENQSAELGFQAYFGPKDIEALEHQDARLGETIDFGVFSVLARPLLWVLKKVYSITTNYGIAIILVTLILKLLFYPLTRQAAVSMHKMKKLQPEMTRIREKHKDDPQTQQRELMQFMVKNKVNPMKGCLPILPQIPVFFAYYQVLLNSIELRHAPFFGWIQDLSSMDPWYVTPLLLGVGMFVQQKLTPTAGMDKNQERILMIMPIVFTLLMLTLPAGMVIYMLTNTVISIAQQQWLNRKLA